MCDDSSCSLFNFAVNFNGTAKTESDFKYIVGVNLSWIVEPAGSGGLVVAGYGPNGEEIFICRAKFVTEGRQHHIPGYKSDSDSCCKIFYRNEAYCVSDYKVLRSI